MNEDLDRRVVDGLRALAGEAQPTESLRRRSLSSSVPPRSRSRLRFLLAAAVVAALALLGTALAVVVNRDDAGDLSVTTEGGAPDETARADAVVDAFLGALRAGDVDGAARYVSSYVAGEGSARHRAVEDWLGEHRDFVEADDLEYATTKSFAWTAESALDVVTVTAQIGVDGERAAIAFVVGPSADESEADVEVLQIQRLGAALASSPPPASALTPGDQVVVSDFPVEGGATAHLNGREVEAVVDHASMSTSVEIPAWVAGEHELVLTMSFASPELPGAGAAWFRVATPGAETSGLGDRPLDYAFVRDGALWAVPRQGDDVRFAESAAVEGFPFASPDGNQVAYATACPCPFWEEWTASVRDGSLRKLAAWGRRWSPNASMRAGVVPIDDEVPTEVSIVDAENDEELFRVSIGVGPSIESLTWVGNERLIALARPGSSGPSAWVIDVDDRSATPLTTDEDGRLVLAEQSRPDGAVAAVRIRGDVAEWGLVRVDGDSVTFERTSPLPSGADGFTLDVGDDLYVDARSGIDRHLIGDGADLFEIDERGNLTHLRSAVDRASAP